MGRGRKPLISFDNQKKIFLKHAEHLQAPNIKYNDSVFSKMSEELEYEMSPIALYISLNRHRSRIFTLDEQISNEVTISNLGCTTSVLQLPLSEKEDCSVVTSMSHGEFQTFSFYLDIHDWKKILPLSALRRRSGTLSFFSYKTLPKFKWSSLIKEKIWIHSKLPCTWTLKKYKICNSTIQLVGKCSQCTAKIRLSSSKKTEKIMKILCKLYNFDKTFIHNPKKKSKLTPYRRKQIAKELRYKSAIRVQNELTSALVTGIDRKAPPVLPSISALRKIKSEARHEHLPHENPILSLFILAKSSFSDNNINMIRDFSIFPDFRLYFWSDSQINYYNKYRMKFKKLTVTIDATGSFFENIYLPDRTAATKRLFLYVGLLTADKKLKSVPIFQMVTDSHSDKAISLWLKKWLSYVDTPPNEIITDDSSALVSACIQAFALYCTTKNYLRHLFSVLEGSTIEKPQAFIRLDTSHFIKKIHNLNCFKTNVDSVVKYFYIRCIVFLKDCENYELAKEIIHNIVNLCLGQYNDDIGNYPTVKSKLDELLHDVTLDGLNSDNENLDKNDEFDDPNNIKDLEFINWFNSIVEEAKKRNPVLVNNKNAYYYPPFIASFRRILMKLPLWSNVLTTFFESENKVPSSSGIESYFKTLKHLVFKTKFKRYRIDEFYKLYAEYLEGEMKSALCDLDQDIINKIYPKKKPRKRTKQINPKKQKIAKLVSSRSTNEDSIFSDQPSYVENWKGQGKISQSKQKSTVKFIRNANLCSSVYIKGKYVEILNTCAFDSVMYLLSTAYNESESFKSIVDTFDGYETIPYYVKCLSDANFKDDDLNNLRAKIITKCIEKPSSSNAYNVACNVARIYEHFLLEYFFSSTFTKTCTNMPCSSNIIKRNNVFLSLNIDIINVFDIGLLEEAIYLSEGKSKCASCDGVATSSYAISNLISFDLNGTNAVALSKVPHTIVLKNTLYRCIGAIEFVAPLDLSGIGHYKSHYFSNEKYFCYDDNCTKIHESTDQDILLHSLSYVLIDDNS